MTSITHVIIGASIAAKVSNPYLAGPIALGLHFVCDAIPHWDLGTNYRKRPKWVTGRWAIAETLTALLIGLVIFYPFVAAKQALFAAVLFSLVPDWLEAPYYLLKPNSPKIFYYFYKFQSIMHSRAQLPWGLVTQIAAVTIALYVGFGI